MVTVIGSRRTPRRLVFNIPPNRTAAVVGRDRQTLVIRTIYLRIGLRRAPLKWRPADDAGVVSVTPRLWT